MVAFGLFFQRPRVRALLFQVFDLFEALLVARFFDCENLSGAGEFFGAQFAIDSGVASTMPSGQANLSRSSNTCRVFQSSAIDESKIWSQTFAKWLIFHPYGNAR